MEPTMSALKNHLQRFYAISDEDFEKVSVYFSVKEFKPREFLIKEQEMEENVFFVVKGVLRKFFRRDKHEVVTQFYLEGDFAHAAVSFYTGEPSIYSIEAIEPTVCLSMRKVDFEKMLDEVPGFEKLYRRVLTNLYVKKDLNEYHKARQSKKERFLNFCKEQPDLLQRIPQKYLASYLEMAPETFCRLKHVRYSEAKRASSY